MFVISDDQLGSTFVKHECLVFVPAKSSKLEQIIWLTESMLQIPLKNILYHKLEALLRGQQYESEQKVLRSIQLRQVSGQFDTHTLLIGLASTPLLSCIAPLSKAWAALSLLSVLLSSFIGQAALMSAHTTY